MDSTTRLDYALFQLTPTRTRFDLLLFYNGKSEKIASGIFEPFISHLKFARDQISRGGYSISLRPPTHAAPWFTKATFERFVRFVSTPAVLERFVSIEREISQIEHSVQANELSNANGAGKLEKGSKSAANGNTRKSTDFSKLQNEVERNIDDLLEENPKIKLQRLLETRRALLRREQAMAYARGIVAGYQMDIIDDLISFADAFGASRLREACSNFKELCKKKHGDGLWMEELAAVEACSPSELSLLGTSGIVLTNEISGPNQNIMLNFAESAGNLASNESLDASKSNSNTSNASSDCKKDDIPSTTAKCQVPLPWPNQIPQYMYNFQGPIQQVPPYQGYPFPPMQPVPFQYPSNMQWSPCMKESTDYHRNQNSSLGKKGKSPNKKEVEYSGEDGSTESSYSDYGSDSDSYLQDQETKHSTKDHQFRKKHRKKSSRTVVIRNINYITPKRRNGEKGQLSDGMSDEDELIDEVSLKQKVDTALGSLEKSHELSYKEKRGADKSHCVANGSAAAEQDSDNDLVTNASEAGKSNGNWNAFQNLLMRDEDTTVNGVERLHLMDVGDGHFTVRSSGGGISATSPAVDLEYREVPRHRTLSVDSFVVTQKDGENEGRTKFDDFENGENFHPLVKRRDSTDENLLLPQRVEESRNELGGILSTSTAESSIKSGRGEDWLVVNHSGKPENHDATNERTIFDGDCIFSSGRAEKSWKDTLIDDSFMLQDRPAVNDLYDSQWKSDISMVADLTLSSHQECVAVDSPREKPEVVDASEPNDLCMVLERDSRFESAKDSWIMDYGIDISLVEANRRCLGVESNNVDEMLTSNGENTNAKNKEVRSKKDPDNVRRSKVLNGSLGKTKFEIVSRIKKPSLASRPMVQKSKLEKEEEIRKKMEELSIQRQKRIAERTAAASKKVPAVESKTTKGSVKCDKNKTRSTTQETNRMSSVRAT